MPQSNYTPEERATYKEMLSRDSKDTGINLFNLIEMRNSMTTIFVNSNDEHVAAIRSALAENDKYCPCSLVKNEDTKCMCKDFRETEEGMCHCGLYIKVKDDKNNVFTAKEKGFHNEYE